MITREFFTFDDVGERLGDPEAVRQAILQHKLVPYVELVQCTCTKNSRTDDFPPSGSNEFSEWVDLSFADDEHEVIGEGSPLAGWFTADYALNGWFRVDDHDASRLARARDSIFSAVTVVVDRNNDKRERFLAKQRTSLTSLWFRMVDIERSIVDPDRVPEEDKPLGTRERATLLCIIGALAAHAKIDIAQHMKAGQTIAAMMPDVKLSSRTIGEHLKAVREAMDSRKG